MVAFSFFSSREDKINAPATFTFACSKRPMATCKHQNNNRQFFSQKGKQVRACISKYNPKGTE